VPLPAWMTPESRRLPNQEEVEPWFETVCSLWDDTALYESVSARAFQIANERYSESVSRARHIQYFTSLHHGTHVFL